MKIKYHYRYINFIIAVITSIFVISCANMGRPEGGPKDIIPPKIVESVPDNYSTNFSSQNIKITFDEYVVLKNINKALIISPPVKEKPEIKLKGKSLYLEFAEKFLDSTTYSINFGNSITDNNEGNILKNFSYVFSTGNIIDSLSISGKLVNSFTGKPEEDVLIMAYSNLTDSVPIKEIPVYIARSLEDGSFTLNNMKDTIYKIFALSDANSNFLFDQPNEAVAFLDTVVKPYVETIVSIDTLHNDSLNTDSIITSSLDHYYPNNIELRLFEEENTKQYLKSFSRPEKSKLQFVFNRELSDSIVLNPVSFSDDQYIVDYSESKDSVMLWITDTTLFSMDSLIVDIEYPMTDSLGNLIIDKKNTKFGFREKSKAPVNKLTALIYPKNKTKLDIANRVYLRFDHPIISIDTSRIDFTLIEDTVSTPIKYTFVKDTLDIKKYYIDFDLIEDKKYILSIDDSAFCDYRGTYIDSTGSSFRARKTDSYGSIILSLSGVTSNGIIQVLGSKDKIIQEQFVTKSGIVTFKLMNIGTYRLKFIDDINGNKVWDTGKYIEKLQPEKTFMYKEEIKVRSNWEMEIDWNPFNS